MKTSWLRAILLSFSLFVLIGGLIYFSWKNLDEQIELRTATAADEIGENLRILVESHVMALQTFSQIEGVPSHKNFHRMAKAIKQNYPGFYAVHWVDDQGVIRRVHPIDKSHGIVGARVYDDPRVREHVRFSREFKVPVISPKVQIHRGVESASVYMPVYGRNHFHGWVNGVIDLQGWFSQYLQHRPDQGLAVRIQWLSEPDSIYDYGPPLMTQWAREVQSQILNQPLSIRVSLNPVLDTKRRWVYGLGAFIGGGLLAVFLSWLVLNLQYSVQQLVNMNRRLAMKSALVSSLTHDMGTPLTVMNLCLERAQASPDPDAQNWARMKKTVSDLRQMMDSVRQMHAAETGRVVLAMKSVDLDNAVAEALEQVKELAERKNIIIPPPVRSGWQVLSEATTLTYNVLPNVLTNAVKFSRPGGRILIQAEKQGDEIVLIVSDFGVGMPPERLKALREDEAVLPQDHGLENGSGLGMLQVRIFMEIYGGRFDVFSRSAAEGEEMSGTTVSLYFRLPTEANLRGDFESRP